MDNDDQLLVPTAVQDRLIRARDEVVHKVWGDSSALYNHAVLCSVGLPYRNLGDDVRTFQRTSGTTSLQLQAGAIPNHGGGFDDIGLPYGPRARLFQSSALNILMTQNSFLFGPLLSSSAQSFTHP